jgi:putative transposase
MRKSFKYRLKPNKAQIMALEGLLGSARSLYNAALEQRISVYRIRKENGARKENGTPKKGVGFKEQCTEMKGARETDAGLSLLSAQSCQNVLRRLDLAYSAFFRRVREGAEEPGFPRFKGKGRYSSITFPQYPTGAKLGVKKLRIQSVGDVRINQHRELVGRIKTVTIKKEREGRWYAVFSCDNVPVRAYPEATNETIGVDVGLLCFAKFSTGESVDNPRWYRATEKKLKAAQQLYESKKKGSPARKRAREVFARLHEKARNKRADFQHKLSRKLVCENKLIAVEGLDIEGMIAGKKSNSGLRKSILDASWGSFVNMIAYKAEEAGRTFIKVPPRSTSQMCSSCGAIVPKLLSERMHNCPHCGLAIDRDLNAALNIERLGASLAESVSAEAHGFSHG